MRQKHIKDSLGESYLERGVQECCDKVVTFHTMEHKRKVGNTQRKSVPHDSDPDGKANDPFVHPKKTMADHFWGTMMFLGCANGSLALPSGSESCGTFFLYLFAFRLCSSP